MLISRENTQGVKYHISSLPDGRTQISRGKKSIIVNASLNLVNRAWFYWTIRGDFIQDAFSFLSADEREFILTGITGEEWKEMFKEQE